MMHPHSGTVIENRLSVIAISMPEQYAKPTDCVGPGGIGFKHTGCGYAKENARRMSARVNTVSGLEHPDETYGQLSGCQVSCFEI
jgi:hypothetical protein